MKLRNFQVSFELLLLLTILSLAACFSVPLQRTLGQRTVLRTYVDDGDQSERSFRVPISNKIDEYIYLGNITIGEGCEQTITVVFDTGSSDLWVSTHVPQKKWHQSFFSNLSNTFQPLGKNFSMKYGTGQANGTYGRDVVKVNGYRVTDQTFAVVTELDDYFMDWNSNGILGMGFSALSRTQENPLPYKIYTQGLVTENMFGFWFNPNKSSPLAGEVYFGGYDQNYIDGPIDYVPLSRAAYWEIKIARFTIEDDFWPMNETNLAAMVDTGTSFMFLPDPFYSKLNNTFNERTKNGTVCDPQDFPNYPSITFDIVTTKGLKSYTLTHEDYLSMNYEAEGDEEKCYIKISKSYIYGEKMIMFGIPFLLKYYTIYDYENRRVGFAPSKMI